MANWECIRSTSYVFPGASVPGAEAFEQDGFEIGLHLNAGCPNNFTPASLRASWDEQLPEWRAAFPTLNAPATNRTHCISWSDWASEPIVEHENGVRFDTNYYYWPEEWVQNRPGMFTGSGFPMRFAEPDGSLIDVYQAATQMTDESGIDYALHIAALLDGALGPQGYYGVFTANMHTDSPQHPGRGRDRRGRQGPRRPGRLGEADAELAGRAQRVRPSPASASAATCCSSPSSPAPGPTACRRCSRSRDRRARSRA